MPQASITKEEEDCSHVKLPDEQTKAALLAAYQKELMALTPDMRRKEMPIAEIQFKTNEMQAMIDVIRKNGGYYDTFNQFDYYPIYPSFQETIAILKQCGTEVGSKVTTENTEKSCFSIRAARFQRISWHRQIQSLENASGSIFRITADAR